MREIILASKSPRRKQLMEMIGYPFSVEVSEVDEKVEPNLQPEEVVKQLAYQKANAVFQRHPEKLVIGSDTIVVVDGEILGKPHSKQQAKEMIQLLSNRAHQVITGVAILSNEQNDVFADESVVVFNEISEAEINDYIETPEAYDKAGAYAIQGWAGKYIREIHGNYYTIMGLPIDLIFNKMKQIVYGG